MSGRPRRGARSTRSSRSTTGERRVGPWGAIATAAGLLLLAAIGGAAIFARPILLWGAKNDRLFAVRFALALRPSIADTSFPDFGTILERAAISRNNALAEVALAGGADPNAAASPSPLTVAAGQGDHEMVRLLLDGGADPNSGRSAPPALWTALEALLDPGRAVYLSRTGHPEGTSADRLKVVEALLLGGANPNVGGGDLTPLALVAREAVVPRAAASGRASATMSSYEEVLDLLLRHGADPNYQSTIQAAGRVVPTSAPPLNEFARLDEPRLVELMLMYGADPNVADSAGQTALSIALRENNAGVALALLRAGGDVAKAVGRQAAAGSAIYVRLLGRRFDPALLPFLFDSPPPVIENERGERVVAWNEEDAPLLRRMLLEGIAWDHARDTALHWAVRENRVELAATLLDAGARVDVENADDETPFELARRLDRVVIGALFVADGDIVEAQAAKRAALFAKAGEMRERARR